MIGLVTVTYNSEAVIPDFLMSVDEQDVKCTVYAVDNASSDRSIELLTQSGLSNVRVLPRTSNGGIAVGNNVGIIQALEDGCEWIVLINNDTSFDSGLIRGLIESADEEFARVVVPSIRFFDNPSEVWFEAATYDHWRGSIPVALPPARADRAVPIEGACTCCALIHRTVFEEVGLMDEHYFVYWDDTDFFLRCHRAGVAMVLEPRLTILHKVSALTGGGESEFSQRERIQNRVYYVRKHNRHIVRWVGLTLTAWNGLRLALGGTARRRSLKVLSKAFIAGWRIPMPGPLPTSQGQGHP